MGCRLWGRTESDTTEATMNRSTPGLPVHHQLPEFTQTHVHRVGDAIQPASPTPCKALWLGGRLRVPPRGAQEISQAATAPGSQGQWTGAPG